MEEWNSLPSPPCQLSSQRETIYSGFLEELNSEPVGFTSQLRALSALEDDPARIWVLLGVAQVGAFGG